MMSIEETSAEGEDFMSEEQMAKHISGDIRKRKRKSNQQLRILKWEYERDGYWNKDKILSVARITGLSES